jgi:hypothetical protein
VWLRLSVVMLGFVRFGWVGFGEVRIEKERQESKNILTLPQIATPDRRLAYQTR